MASPPPPPYVGSFMRSDNSLALEEVIRIATHAYIPVPIYLAGVGQAYTQRETGLI